MIDWPSEPTSECVSGGSTKAKQKMQPVCGAPATKRQVAPRSRAPASKAQFQGGTRPATEAWSALPDRQPRPADHRTPSFRGSASPRGSSGPRRIIVLRTDGVRLHTAARRARIYMDHAMPEHIARALVRGLVLSPSPGRFVLVHRVQLHFQRSWRIVVAWCCNRHHKSALTVSATRLTLSGRCRLYTPCPHRDGTRPRVWSSSDDQRLIASPARP
jgi:hypothetical protein